MITANEQLELVRVLSEDALATARGAVKTLQVHAKNIGAATGEKEILKHLTALVDTAQIIAETFGNNTAADHLSAAVKALGK